MKTLSRFSIVVLLSVLLFSNISICMQRSPATFGLPAKARFFKQNKKKRTLADRESNQELVLPIEPLKKKRKLQVGIESWMRGEELDDQVKSSLFDPIGITSKKRVISKDCKSIAANFTILKKQDADLFGNGSESDFGMDDDLALSFLSYDKEEEEEKDIYNCVTYNIDTKKYDVARYESFEAQKKHDFGIEGEKLAILPHNNLPGECSACVVDGKESLLVERHKKHDIIKICKDKAVLEDKVDEVDESSDFLLSDITTRVLDACFTSDKKYSFALVLEVDKNESVFFEDSLSFSETEVDKNESVCLEDSLFFSEDEDEEEKKRKRFDKTTLFVVVYDLEKRERVHVEMVCSHPPMLIDKKFRITCANDYSPENMSFNIVFFDKEDNFEELRNMKMSFVDESKKETMQKEQPLTPMTPQQVTPMTPQQVTPVTPQQEEALFSYSFPNTSQPTLSPLNLSPMSPMGNGEGFYDGLIDDYDSNLTVLTQGPDYGLTPVDETQQLFEDKK